MSQTIVFLHGLGKRTADYANPLIENIKSQLTEYQDVAFKPIYYGDILQNAESVLTSKLQASPTWKKEHFKELRAPLNDWLMDALQWYDPMIRPRIRSRITPLIPNDKFHLVLHSWGGVTMLLDPNFHEILYQAMSVITIGCAIHLEDVGMETFPRWLQAKWRNFYHSMDLIAAPLANVYGCTDEEVLDAGPPTELVGPLGLPFVAAAHNCYWESKQVAKYIVSRL